MLAGVLAFKQVRLWPSDLAVESGIFAFLILVVISSTIAQLYGRAIANGHRHAEAGAAELVHHDCRTPGEIGFQQAPLLGEPFNIPGVGVPRPAPVTPPITVTSLRRKSEGVEVLGVQLQPLTGL